MALFDGLSFKPKNTGLKGNIPAIVSITVGSSGIKDALGMILCNFSFGDYFKEEAIQWAWELVTNIYRLSAENIIVSVFREDKESAKIWREEIGIHPDRIIRIIE